jgi:hypothetical protein
MMVSNVSFGASSALELLHYERSCGRNISQKKEESRMILINSIQYPHWGFFFRWVFFGFNQPNKCTRDLFNRRTSRDHEYGRPRKQNPSSQSNFLTCFVYPPFSGPLFSHDLSIFLSINQTHMCFKTH